MTIVLDDRILDFGIERLNTEATYIELCSAQPTTFAEATTTYLLGFRFYGAGNVFAPPSAATGGRTVSSALVTDGNITTTGTAGWLAVTDRANLRLLAAIQLAAPEEVTVGNTFSFSADVTMLSGAGA